MEKVRTESKGNGKTVIKENINEARKKIRNTQKVLRELKKKKTSTKLRQVIEAKGERKKKGNGEMKIKGRNGNRRVLHPSPTISNKRRKRI